MNLFDGQYDLCEQDDTHSFFGKIYPRYVQALASTAHTYGNVLATAQRWCLNVFGTHYDNPNRSMFKSIHVSSRIAHSQLLRVPGKHIKRARPLIAFSPRVEYDEDVFMKGTLLTQKFGGRHTTGTNGVVDLHPFFYDGECGASMYYTIVRRCMYVDVLVSFDTAIEQMNYMDYLKTELDWNAPFDMNVWLEAYLSNDVLKMLADIAGVHIHDPNDNTVTDFLNYMNGHSVDPVTYKVAGSTGNEEFYRYYKTNIIAILQNLEKTNGDTINHVMTNFNITFSIKMEFWSPGLLYLMSDKIKNIQSFVPDDATMVPIFADVFFEEDLQLNPGWQVYGHTSYILEKPNDECSYADLIQERVREVIRYHIENGIAIASFVDIKVRRMGHLLREGEEYQVDYLNNVVKFFNKDYGFATYVVIVTINTLYVNDAIKNMNNLK